MCSVSEIPQNQLAFGKYSAVILFLGNLKTFRDIGEQKKELVFENYGYVFFTIPRVVFLINKLVA